MVQGPPRSLCSLLVETESQSAAARAAVAAVDALVRRSLVRVLRIAVLPESPIVSTRAPSSPSLDLEAPVSGLMDRLKSGTADRHHHAETRPLQRAMAAGTIDRALWRRWAEQMLVVHRALAQAAGDLADRADHGVPATLLDVAGGHVVRLEADVRALDGAADAIVPLPAAERFVRELEAASADDGAAALRVLGALYVLEGSMNGNRFLAKRIAGAWGDARGLGYLDPYGAEQRTRWQAWRAEANALALAPDEDAAVVAGAEATFDAIAELSDEVTAAAG